MLSWAGIDTLILRMSNLFFRKTTLLSFVVKFANSLQLAASKTYKNLLRIYAHPLSRNARAFVRKDKQESRILDAIFIESDDQIRSWRVYVGQCHTKCTYYFYMNFLVFLAIFNLMIMYSLFLSPLWLCLLHVRGSWLNIYLRNFSQ